MSAGVVDFTIERGADWATQVYWVAEQTGQSIPLQSPAEMDIVSASTGQRLIRLDDGSNGGIDLGGAPQGIVQLKIDDTITVGFPAGRYVYDLFVYTTAVSPIPSQRVRLLTGSVIVAQNVTDLGVPLGQTIGSTVQRPDIVLGAKLTGTELDLTFDPSNPTNAGPTNSLETGHPMRAALVLTGSLTGATSVRYVNSTGAKGPLVDLHDVEIAPGPVDDWINTQSIITVTYDNQTHGLVVSKAETSNF
jgi:hypothetical protein